MITAYADERALDTTSLLKKLGTSENGLSSREAIARLERDGENKFKKPKTRSVFVLAFRQFTSTVMLVLIAAAIVSAALGNLKDAIGIAFAVLLSASIGFIMEYRSDKTIEHLSKLTRNTVRVRRGGEEALIDSVELVSGDIIILEEGAHVPADLRLLTSVNAMANESALTGESLPVEKDASSRGDNLLFAGTLLASGAAEAVVLSTGMRTQVGSIANLVSQDTDEITPLQKNMNEVGKVMSAIVVSATILFFLYGWLILKGSLASVLTSSVVLAVAGVSEGLPTVIGLTLALGMLRMAKKNAIARRLSVVEDLGAVTAICTDKTGTLTMNTMRPLAVSAGGKLVEFEGSATNACVLAIHERALVSAVIANAATLGKNGEPIGDPTETGLLLAAAYAGLDVRKLKKTEIVHRAPFDSTRKMMSVIARNDGAFVLHAKGAGEQLLERCSHVADGNREIQLTGVVREHVVNGMKALASKGARVIGIASRPASSAEDIVEDKLTFLGFVALYDPPRPEAKAALAACAHAGIRVFMITGDSKETAENIAKETGFPTVESMSGAEFEALTETEKTRALECKSIFYRVSPVHKHDIVSALKAAGHVIVVTGDGVNDAPAMKKADIGVCMGRTGSDVTKDVAGLILLDDNFATIVHAIEYGRALFVNILNFVRFQFTTTTALMGTVFAGVLAGFPTPFFAVQILFINVIMDGPPALSLGVEPASPGVMMRKPRNPKEPYLDRRFLSRIAYGAVVMIAAMLALMWWLKGAGIQFDKANTILFVVMVTMQLFHAFNCKSDSSSLSSNAFSNKWLVLAAAGSFAVLLASIYVSSIAAFMNTVPLSFEELALSIAFSSIILIADEARKAIEKMRRRDSSATV
ncbi:MAG: cation-transporting P-type ATPase [Candidatus Micrarchaeia archaeon]